MDLDAGCQWLSEATKQWGEQRPRIKPRPRDTARMKLQARIVFSYRADSLGDAGGVLDDVLQRARERDDVEIDSVQLGTP